MLNSTVISVFCKGSTVYPKSKNRKKIIGVRYGSTNTSGNINKYQTLVLNFAKNLLKTQPVIQNRILLSQIKTHAQQLANAKISPTIGDIPNTYYVKSEEILTEDQKLKLAYLKIDPKAIFFYKTWGKTKDDLREDPQLQLKSDLEKIPKHSQVFLLDEVFGINRNLTSNIPSLYTQLSNNFIVYTITELETYWGDKQLIISRYHTSSIINNIEIINPTVGCIDERLMVKFFCTPNVQLNLRNREALNITTGEFKLFDARRRALQNSLDYRARYFDEERQKYLRLRRQELVEKSIEVYYSLNGKLARWLELREACGFKPYDSTKCFLPLPIPKQYLPLPTNNTDEIIP